MTRTLIHREEDTINLPVDNVWAVVSAFGAIKTWMPTIERCRVEGEGIGAVRTVEFGGNSMQEKLEKLDSQNHTISYQFVEPTGMPLEGGYGTISLKAVNDGTTSITWVADAEKVNDEGKQLLAGMLSTFIQKSIVGLKGALLREAVPLM
jgi:uncharacterized protein YndB with AHSA1/START domain